MQQTVSGMFFILHKSGTRSGLPGIESFELGKMY